MIRVEEEDLLRLQQELAHHRARIPELIGVASRHERDARIARLRASYWRLTWECYLASEAREDEEGRLLAAQRDRDRADLATYGEEP